MAIALHTGFQLTVSWLVYPAVAKVSPARSDVAHAAHSLRITTWVGLVFLVALASP